MSKNPTISIITICYNSVATIENTILSVLNQNYDKLDYVIVDGASTDGTQEVVKKYIDCLGTFISEHDEGISDAFNKGIKVAKGDIVCMINSDDIMCPNALAAVAEAYEDGIDMYRGNTIIRNPDTGYSGRDIPSMRFPLVPVFVSTCHQGTFISLDAHRKWGLYRKDLRYMMDLDLMTRLFLNGAKMKYVNADIAEFRLGGITETPLKKKKYDIIHCVTYNGGSMFTAYMSYLYFRSVDIAKNIIIGLFGRDFLKNLHYKHNGKA